MPTRKNIRPAGQMIYCSVKGCGILLINQTSIQTGLCAAHRQNSQQQSQQPGDTAQGRQLGLFGQQPGQGK